MNALVGIRANATGLYSPTPEQRATVEQSLQSTSTSESSRADESVLVAESTESGAVTSTESITSALPEQELGKDAFLQLLVLEMQNQDPLEPIDNADMLAQLAQFSALEAMTNISESFDSLNGNVDQLNFISANSLIGTTVTGVGVNGDVLTGVVEAVHLDGSNVVLTVDGEFMYVAGIISMEASVAEETGEDGDPVDGDGETEEDGTTAVSQPEV